MGDQIFSVGSRGRAVMKRRAAIMTGAVLAPLTVMLGFSWHLNSGLVAAAVGISAAVALGLGLLIARRVFARVSYRLSDNRLTRIAGPREETVFLAEISSAILQRDRSGSTTAVIIKSPVGIWNIESIYPVLFQNSAGDNPA